MLGIDLGSNTLRAVLMDTNLNILQEDEFIISAAKNLNESGKIGTQAIEKLKNALKTMQEKGYELRSAKAVATAAFRRASNSLEIFETLKKEFGICFEIIDAKTEAKLSILGMQNALLRLNFLEKNLAFCDLGGASCELSFGRNYESFDFGIITFYEKSRTLEQNLSNFNFKKLLKKSNFLQKCKDKKLKLHFMIDDKRLKDLAFKAFDEVSLAKKHLRKFKGKTIVLNSGVPTTLLALKQGIMYEDYQASFINGKCLVLNDFLKFGFKLWKMDKLYAKIAVGHNRKNYLSAGCFLFYALFDKYKFVVVDEGLREGICVNEFNQRRKNER
ncbi:exopolyphosphatase [Campylobacter sp. MIT 99-7217]|uniref:Ppx/GppA phosphatase family protein n=1 Tax=Campylobacter sp. MIT 99-7217 TaxID=535091 RepID=UPI00115A55FE|nr:Ppx/GppA family phosphatase [Campylobacter sp. MIT 99-7217]TQR31920.1 exopolyphosphatase [Campylobacter sp. MIT 99-7217]